MSMDTSDTDVEMVGDTKAERAQSPVENRPAPSMGNSPQDSDVEMDMDDDPVVQELDVFVTHEFLKEMQLWQYPLREQDSYPLADATTLRMRPSFAKVEAKFAREAEDDVNRNPNSEFADASFCLQSRTLVPKTVHFVGLLSEDSKSINLAAVDSTVQFRPHLQHMDKIHQKKLAADATSDDEDGGDEATGPKQLQVQFKKQATARQMERQKASLTHIQEQEAQDRWLDLQVHPSTSSLSTEHRAKWSAPEDVGPMVDSIKGFTMAEYLERIRLPRAGKATAPTLHGGRGMLTREELQSLHPAERVMHLLSAAHILPGSRVANISRLSPEETLRVLTEVAICVRGCWVLKNEWAFPFLVSERCDLEAAGFTISDSLKKECCPAQGKAVTGRRRRAAPKEETTAEQRALAQLRYYVVALMAGGDPINRRQIQSELKMPHSEVHHNLKNFGTLHRGQGWLVRGEETSQEFSNLPGYAEVVEKDKNFLSKILRDPMETERIKKVSAVVEGEVEASKSGLSAEVLGEVNTLFTKTVGEGGRRTYRTLVQGSIAHAHFNGDDEKVKATTLDVGSGFRIRKYCKGRGTPEQRVIIAALFANNEGAGVKKSDITAAFKASEIPEISGSQYTKFLQEFAVFHQHSWRLNPNSGGDDDVDPSPKSGDRKTK